MDSVGRPSAQATTGQPGLGLAGRGPELQVSDRRTQSIASPPRNSPDANNGNGSPTNYSEAEYEAAQLLMGPMATAMKRDNPPAEKQAGEDRAARVLSQRPTTKNRLNLAADEEAALRIHNVRKTKTFLRKVSKKKRKGENGSKASRKPLERFLPSDRKILNEILKATAYPNSALQETLAQLLDTSRLRIRRWFEYQRYKEVKADPNHHFHRQDCKIDDFDLQALLAERAKEVAAIAGGTSLQTLEDAETAAQAVLAAEQTPTPSQPKPELSSCQPPPAAAATPSAAPAVANDRETPPYREMLKKPSLVDEDDDEPMPSATNVDTPAAEALAPPGEPSQPAPPTTN